MSCRGEEFGCVYGRDDVVPELNLRHPKSVKYGDSLRRFNSHVTGKGLLDIDLDGLKARILSLFKLSRDTNLILTYIDEDNDNVALVDEDDFRYAVKQRLNPLRITARLDPSSIRGNSLAGGAEGVLDHDPIQNSLDEKLCTNPSPVDVLRDSGARPHVKGLGSLLIQDITIKNGNNMNQASFTKKWRMCNNGTVSWPANTNLVSIGGDKLTDTLAVEIQNSWEVCVNDEVDISVDFTAPTKPGWYSSYWRLNLSEGGKFGEVICVDVQVSTSIKDSKRNLGLMGLANKMGEVLRDPLDIVLTFPESNSTNMGTLSGVKRSTESEEDDEDKRFKKFKRNWQLNKY